MSMKGPSRLNTTSPYLTIILIFLLGGIVWQHVYPALSDGMIVYDRECFQAYRSPVNSLILLGLLAAIYFPLHLVDRGHKRALIEENGLLYASALCWSAGFANLLFGFIGSYIGIWLFFVLGFSFQATHYIRKGIKPSFSPQLFVGACVAYVLYEALTLLWTDNFLKSQDYFRRELWLAIVPLIALAYPPKREAVAVFMEYALRITFVYIAGIVVLYVWVCGAAGEPLTACLTFNKGYFAWPEGDVSPHFLMNVFGWNHYTYLGFIFTAPFLFFSFRDRYPAGQSSVLFLVGLGMFSFFMIFQSRVSLLFFLFVVTMLLSLRLLRNNFWKAFGSTLLLAAFGATILLAIAPEKAMFFMDEHRRNLVSVAATYALDRPFSGFGLGSSERLISPFMQGYKAGHFHNQWIQSYLEGGILSVLLITLVPLSYLWSAARRRNRAALVMGLFFLLILIIELVFIFAEYLVGMLLMLSFLLGSMPKKAPSAKNEKQTQPNDVLDYLL